MHPPWPHPQYREATLPSPHVGGRGLSAPGFHSVVEASRGNNSLIPFRNQGQETTCSVPQSTAPSARLSLH